MHVFYSYLHRTPQQMLTLLKNALHCAKAYRQALHKIRRSAHFPNQKLLQLGKGEILLLQQHKKIENAYCQKSHSTLWQNWVKMEIHPPCAKEQFLDLLLALHSLQTLRSQNWDRASSYTPSSFQLSQYDQKTEILNSRDYKEVPTRILLQITPLCKSLQKAL